MMLYMIIMFDIHIIYDYMIVQLYSTDMIYVCI